MIFTPIIFDKLETPENILLLNKLNNTIQAIEKNFITTKGANGKEDTFIKSGKDKLTTIIDLCEKYITEIPKKERNPCNINLERLPPNFLNILQIQKKAVQLLYLPDCETDAKARWSMLKSIYSLQKSVKGKPLNPEYWDEYKFKGGMTVCHWSENYIYNNYFSYQEIVDYSKKQVGIGQGDSIYIENLQDYEITFEDDGKLKWGGKLLDTKNTISICRCTNEVIFVMGLNRKIYCSDPNFANDNVRTDYMIRHSSFLHGNKIMSGGTLSVNQGVIKKIRFESGHYKPSDKELIYFLKYLQEKIPNLDLEDIDILSYSKDEKKFVTVNPFEYVKNSNKISICIEKQADSYSFYLRNGNVRISEMSITTSEKFIQKVSEKKNSQELIDYLKTQSYSTTLMAEYLIKYESSVDFKLTFLDSELKNEKFIKNSLANTDFFIESQPKQKKQFNKKENQPLIQKNDKAANNRCCLII